MLDYQEPGTSGQTIIPFANGLHTVIALHAMLVPQYGQNQIRRQCLPKDELTDGCVDMNCGGVTFSAFCMRLQLKFSVNLCNDNNRQDRHNSDLQSDSSLWIEASLGHHH